MTKRASILLLAALSLTSAAIAQPYYRPPPVVVYAPPPPAYALAVFPSTRMPLSCLTEWAAGCRRPTALTIRSQGSSYNNRNGALPGQPGIETPAAVTTGPATSLAAITRSADHQACWRGGAAVAL